MKKQRCPPSPLYSTIMCSLALHYPLSDIWSPDLASSKTLLGGYDDYFWLSSREIVGHIFGCILQECLPSGLNEEGAPAIM